MEKKCNCARFRSKFRLKPTSSAAPNGALTDYLQQTAPSKPKRVGLAARLRLPIHPLTVLLPLPLVPPI